MPWDPLGALPNERRWIWLTAAFWLLLLRGPAFVENLRATRDVIPDFFQEYASATKLVGGAADLLRPSPDERERYLRVSLDDKRAARLCERPSAGLGLGRFALRQAWFLHRVPRLGPFLPVRAGGDSVDRTAPVANAVLALVRRSATVVARALSSAVGTNPPRSTDIGAVASRQRIVGGRTFWPAVAGGGASARPQPSSCSQPFFSFILHCGGAGSW